MLVDFRRILTKCDITTAFKDKIVDKLYDGRVQRC